MMTESENVPTVGLVCADWFSYPRPLGPRFKDLNPYAVIVYPWPNREAGWIWRSYLTQAATAQAANDLSKLYGPMKGWRFRPAELTSLNNEVRDAGRKESKL